MTNHCPLCTRDLAPKEVCRDRFDACLAFEYENPLAYGAVHHLTVPCYMLQHNAYSRRGWLEVRELLAQFVQKGVTPAEALRQIRGRLDGGQRDWSITRGEKLAGFEAISWSRTIGDVRLDDPDAYCADVQHWAAAVLADTEELATASQDRGGAGQDSSGR